MEKCLDNEKSLDIKITNELGLHARAAASFVKVASQYKCEVTVSKDKFSVNGKSIMGVMMLAAPKGSSIRICTAGEDGEAALEALKNLIINKFGEGR